MGLNLVHALRSLQWLQPRSDFVIITMTAKNNNRNKTMKCQLMLYRLIKASTFPILKWNQLGETYTFYIRGPNIILLRFR